MDISKDEIERLRSTFLSELAAKGDDSIHPKDLQRVKSSDFWLERFLKHHEKDQTKALEMLWNCVKWRNDFKTNEITEDNIKMDIMVKGGLFPHGKDIDGVHMLVFKCKLHTKGSVDMNDLKRVVIYWFERLERITRGNQITIFFDMESCGLSNMDMEFTKYLINLFKDYYPFFLNYIIIYEMPWVLSAAFKIIKSWLPEKAVEKIKFVSKKDIKTFVPLDQALKCWGGENPYTFSFVPEEREDEEDCSEPTVTSTPNGFTLSSTNYKKVHFSDDSSKSELSGSNEDKEEYKSLKLQPPNIVNFVREGSEYVSTLEIKNVNPLTNISFKIKTTSPEKFRVKPNTGCLTPGAKAVVTIILLEGYLAEALKHDKFLVLSMPYESADVSPQTMAELWKNTPKKQIREHRLKCQCQTPSANNHTTHPESSEQDGLKKLTSSVAQLTKSHNELHQAVKKTQQFQIATLILCLIIGLVLGYLLRSKIPEGTSSHTYCPNPNAP